MYIISVSCELWSVINPTPTFMQFGAMYVARSTISYLNMESNGPWALDVQTPNLPMLLLMHFWLAIVLMQASSLCRTMHFCPRASSVGGSCRAHLMHEQRPLVLQDVIQTWMATLANVPTSKHPTYLPSTISSIEHQI